MNPKTSMLPPLENSEALPVQKSGLPPKSRPAAPMGKREVGRRSRNPGRRLPNLFHEFSANDRKRFNSKVAKTSDSSQCWEWTGYKCKEGYGRIKWMNKTSSTLAHRVAYVMHTGDNTSLLVCHRCDNPSCCNPSHLFTGTDKDNSDDRDSKGRLKIRFGNDNHAHTNPEIMARGEHNGNARFTADDIRHIRKLHNDGMSYKAVGRAMATSGTYVAQIVRREFWKHI